MSKQGSRWGVVTSFDGYYGLIDDGIQKHILLAKNIDCREPLMIRDWVQFRVETLKCKDREYNIACFVCKMGCKRISSEKSHISNKEKNKYIKKE